jgi:predicted TIM-barrel fold metal-dependent hydrolase
MSGSISCGDCHIHFFARRFFRALLGSEEGPSEEATLATLSRQHGFEPPSAYAEEHGRRWLSELDRHQVGRAVFFASLPQEVPDVLAAAALAPRRISVFSVLDPSREGANSRVDELLDHGVRGFLFFPAAHHYRIDGDAIDPVWRRLETAGAIASVHCGILKFPLQEKLGFTRSYDLRYGDPLSLLPVAHKHPRLRWIVPHFGAGFFREALMLASQAENVVFDTSSSNAWRRVLPEAPPLRDVFARSLDVLGPRRLVFGTDSSVFPRGWRRDVFEEQDRVLRDLGATDEERALVFHENLDRLLG